MIDEKRKWPRSRAIALAAQIVERLWPYCSKIEIAGSIRREKLEVGDIEILYIPRFSDQVVDLLGTTEPTNLVDQQLDALLKSGVIAKRPSKTGSFSWGDKNKLAVHVASGIPVDFFSTTADCWWNYLVCRTGGADSNVAICNAAIAMGWKWTPYGAGFYRIGHTEKMTSERQVFEFVGLPYLHPKDRK